MKNVIKKLKKYAHKDLILSIIIFIIITVPYLFNLYPNSLKEQKINTKDYIFTGKYNLKKMSLQEIDNLPNISHKLALKIYNNRNKIKKLKDFAKIKGIGIKKLKMLKKYIILPQ